MLEFYRGNPEDPSGSLLFYCKVRGKNPFHPDAKILVCHVVVSFLGASTSNFPVVVFPPSTLQSEDQFFEILALDDGSDVVRLEDFEIPEDKQESDYMSERLERFNDRVYEYVEMYRKQLDRRVKIKKPATQLPPFPDQPLLAPPPPMNDVRALEILTSAVRDGLQDSMPIHEALSHLHVSRPELDLVNLEHAIEQEDQALCALYLDKFKAILDEKYEDAAKIQIQIRSFNTAG